jgi:hypothetical protein
MDKRDRLVVTIKRPEYFLTPNFRMPSLDSFVATLVPSQFESAAQAAKIQGAASSAGSSVKSIFAGSFAVNLLFSFAL